MLPLPLCAWAFVANPASLFSSQVLLLARKLCLTPSWQLGSHIWEKPERAECILLMHTKCMVCNDNAQTNTGFTPPVLMTASMAETAAGLYAGSNGSEWQDATSAPAMAFFIWGLSTPCVQMGMVTHAHHGPHSRG